MTEAIRIAVLNFVHETVTFLPNDTTLDNFVHGSSPARGEAYEHFLGRMIAELEGGGRWHGVELDLSDFDVPQAIDNALTLMRERASRHGIALAHIIGEGVREIRGDERKFKQVLLNLLSNAVKFTPSGGKVEVRARLADGLLEIAVADTGEGIAPEDQAAVFEEFRQVGKSSKKIEGTGLGLALCRKFVELHGGTIGVESQAGVGSTFTFTMPVRTPPNVRARIL